MKKSIFISKVMQMALSMLAFNISGMMYGVFVSRRVGPRGIGVFHLIMSVYTLAVTFSVSGMGLTVTRLISDHRNNPRRGIVSACTKVCMVTSGTAGIVTTVFAEQIASGMLNLPECTPCIRIMGPLLMCVGASSVMSGAFTAEGRVGAITASKAISEVVTWLVTLILLPLFGRELAYIPVIIAFGASIFSEFMCNLIAYTTGKKHSHFKAPPATYRQVLALCVPIAVGSYLRTGLSSAENLLIPRLVPGGIVQYGILKGMSIPIAVFPSVLTGAFNALIVPEIASRKALKHKNSPRYISGLSLEHILKFGFLCSGIFLFWHEEIANTFFDNSEAGAYLGALSLLPVFMLTDSVVDSLLKGLNEQVYSLKINIIDSMLRVLLVWVAVPQVGIHGYIGILYASEIINLGFSYARLRKNIGIKFPLTNGILIPCVAMLSSQCLSAAGGLNRGGAGIIIFVCLYLLLNYIFSKMLPPPRDRHRN